MKYDTPVKRANFYKNLTERLESLPGVRSAGAVLFLPLARLDTLVSHWRERIPDRGPPAGSAGPGADGGLPHGHAGLLQHHGNCAAARAASSTSMTTWTPSASRSSTKPWSASISRTRIRSAGSIATGGAPMEIVGVVADAKLYGLDAADRARHLRASHAASLGLHGAGRADRGRPGGHRLGRAPRDPEARPGTAHLQRAHHGDGALGFADAAPCLHADACRYSPRLRSLWPPSESTG